MMKWIKMLLDSKAVTLILTALLATSGGYIYTNHNVPETSIEPVNIISPPIPKSAPQRCPTVVCGCAEGIQAHIKGRLH